MGANVSKLVPITGVAMAPITNIRFAKMPMWQVTSNVQLVQAPVIMSMLPSRFTGPCVLKTVNGSLVDSRFQLKSHYASPVYCVSIGPTALESPCCTDPCDSYNLLCGYYKRLVPLMPVVKLSVLLELRQFVRGYLTFFDPLPSFDYLDPCLFNSWLDSRESYTLQRKAQLRAAFDTVATLSIRSKDYNCKSFVKRETYEVPKHLRFINSRSDRFKVVVGPIISLIEQSIYQDDHFVKHERVLDLPKILMRLSGYKYFVESDYTSFESGFSPVYADFVECEMWRYFLKNNPRVLKIILDAYLVPVAGGFKPRVQRLYSNQYEAQVVGSRMSGEMWTSLANSFSNLMNVLFLAYKSGQVLDGFVEGDDGVFGCNSLFLNPAMFEQLGFRIRLKYLTSLEQTSFCSVSFQLNSLRPLITPECIVRLFWSTASCYFGASMKKRLALLRCKAQVCCIWLPIPQ